MVFGICLAIVTYFALLSIVVYLCLPAGLTGGFVLTCGSLFIVVDFE